MPDAALPRRSSFRILKVRARRAGVLALLAAGAIAYLIATFRSAGLSRPDRRARQGEKRRTLEIRGEIGLSFWPDVAVRLGEATLSECECERRVVTGEREAQSASWTSKRPDTLKLFSLLERELVASEFAVTGRTCASSAYADGSLNIDDLLESEGAAPRFDIGRITVERSTISYQDLGTGARYELTEVAIRTGRLANTGTSPIALAFVGSDAHGTFRLAAKLEGRSSSTSSSALRAASGELEGKAACPACPSRCSARRRLFKERRNRRRSTLSARFRAAWRVAIAARSKPRISRHSRKWPGEERVAMSAKGTRGARGKLPPVRHLKGTKSSPTLPR